MFLIHPSGKTIAFGGRIFESNDSAKYLNSPETRCIKKAILFTGYKQHGCYKKGGVRYFSRRIYGFHQALSPIFFL